MAFTMGKTVTAAFTNSASEVALSFLEVGDASGNAPDGNTRKYGNKLRVQSDAGVYLKVGPEGMSDAAVDGEDSMFFPAGIVEIIDLSPTEVAVSGITSSGTANVTLATGYGD